MASASKFRFLSPGVHFEEIDQSVVIKQPPAPGPVVIGRTAKGPAMQPVQVSSVAELERVFGPTANGNVGSADVFRTGVPTSPTFATYAAKAFLRNSSPVTVIRLGGTEPTTTSTDDAGWSADKTFQIFTLNATNDEATLAAVIYAASDFEVQVEDGTGWGVDNGTSYSNGFSIKLGAATEAIKVSLNPTDSNFIRKVLNTNPTLFATKKYFLGETYENSLPTNYSQVFLGLADDSFGTFTEASLSAESPVVIGDHVDGEEASAPELFKLVGLNSGGSLSRDIKISIENVRESKNLKTTKYGSFDVVVRRLFDIGGQEIVLERFNSVNLDATSDNYIAKVIGDTYYTWDGENSLYLAEGIYENNSAYIRVEMLGGASEGTLPHGFKIPGVPTLSMTGISGADIVHPTVPLYTGSVSLSQAKSKRFGLVSDSVKNADLVDIVRCKPAVTTGDATYFSARYIKDTASKYSYGETYNTVDVLTEGIVLGFEFPMFGGFDGLDIKEAEPLVNERLLAEQSETSGHAYRTIKQALEMTRNVESIDMSILCVPGLKKASLTDTMIEICESRGDSIALIDLVGDYQQPYEHISSEDSTYESIVNGRPRSIKSVVSNLKGRSIDSSYGAAYFPAVFSPTEGIFLPASLAALGAFGGTEGRSALWFAPAGFNRGGLTEANSGVSVSRAALSLTSTDRDTLYETNINPIATFPGEGIVIFGQKTLMTSSATTSALDRINVRRLMNFIKKQIKRVADRIVFEQNVPQTWDRFKNVVNPFLAAIRSGNGIEDAYVQLDETTTTPDYVDQNIMYAKIYVKPVHAIEYIAIDYVITRSGASFFEQ